MYNKLQLFNASLFKIIGLFVKKLNEIYFFKTNLYFIVFNVRFEEFVGGVDIMLLDVFATRDTQLINFKLIKQGSCSLNE